jgi:RNA polymerase sigma-32 factor
MWRGIFVGRRIMPASGLHRAKDYPMNEKIDASVFHLVEKAKRFPMLSHERERDLAIAWRDRADRGALDQLVGSHLRLVAKIARDLAGYGLPLADLISEGNVGLMQAASKFDPHRGFRFATYAMWWIRAAIQEYILRSWSLVKIGTTAAQKKLFFNLRRSKERLQEFGQGDLLPSSVRAIAEDLDVAEADVVEMNRRLSGRDNSLNAVLGSDVDSEWLELLPDGRPNQETVVGDTEEEHRRRGLLGTALKRLTPREHEIIVERYLKDEPATFDELSRRHAVSRERIRQIEVRAVEKLRRLMVSPPSGQQSAAAGVFTE